MDSPILLVSLTMPNIRYADTICYDLIRWDNWSVNFVEHEPLNQDVQAQVNNSTSIKFLESIQVFT